MGAIFIAYCLYFIVLGIAAVLYPDDDTTSAALVVTVLGLHFALALFTARSVDVVGRYCSAPFRSAVAIMTDAILSVDFIIAILWLAKAVDHEWGAYVIAAAFVGNMGCVYLRMEFAYHELDDSVL
jgi:hypothetical protein